MGKRPQNVNIAPFLDTIDHRNLKLGAVVVCDVGFRKMYILMTCREGQRSSGAIICRKLGFFVEKHNFFSHYVECVNERGHAHGRHIGRVCCIMFAHLTEVKGHQGPA